MEADFPAMWEDLQVRWKEQQQFPTPIMPEAWVMDAMDLIQVELSDGEILRSLL